MYLWVCLFFYALWQSSGLPKCQEGHHLAFRNSWEDIVWPSRTAGKTPSGLPEWLGGHRLAFRNGWEATVWPSKMPGRTLSGLPDGKSGHLLAFYRGLPRLL